MLDTAGVTRVLQARGQGRAQAECLISRPKQDPAAIGSRCGKVELRIDGALSNLWKDNTNTAITHLQYLMDTYFAIEEPAMPKDATALSALSVALDKAIILDESLCTLADLDAYDTLPGRFVANIKVSRVGGVLRAGPGTRFSVRR